MAKLAWLAILPGVFAASLPAAESVERKAETCAACHGPGGNSTMAGVPAIAGQPALYTVMQLMEYRSNSRDDPRMTPLAANLTDKEIEGLSAYFEKQKPATNDSSADPAKAKAGKELADAQHCGSCHRPDYSGQNQMARLAGQREDYLLKTMQDYRAGKRAGMDGTMVGILRGSSDTDLENIAAYLASLK